MLAIWRAHGLDVILREAWRNGIVLAGLSAGSLCWFDGDRLSPRRWLGGEIIGLPDGGWGATVAGSGVVDWYREGKKI